MIEENAKKEAKQQYAKRQVERFGRLEEYSLDENNKRKYSSKRKNWESVVRKIDTLMEHEPRRIRELAPEHRNDIYGFIANSHPKIKGVIEKYSDDIRFVNERAIGRSVSTKRGIRTNFKIDKEDVRGAYTATFHEMGHEIDRLSGGISYNTPDFKNALVSDFERVVNAYKEEYNMNIEEVYETIGNALKDDHRHQISDIVSGITDNRCYGNWRHYDGYWNKPHKLETESFAHFFEAYVRNDSEKIEMLSEMFPEATKVFFGLLEEL